MPRCRITYTCVDYPSDISSIQGKARFDSDTMTHESCIARICKLAIHLRLHGDARCIEKWLLIGQNACNLYRGIEHALSQNEYITLFFK